MLVCIQSNGLSKWFGNLSRTRFNYRKLAEVQDHFLAKWPIFSPSRCMFYSFQTKKYTNLLNHFGVVWHNRRPICLINSRKSMHNWTWQRKNIKALFGSECHRFCEKSHKTCITCDNFFMLRNLLEKAIYLKFFD